MNEAFPLRAEGLSKVYRSAAGPVEALRDVSLAIPRGGFAVVRGPSGSGKSTLLALLGGLAPPTRGRVIVDGRDLEVLSPAARTRVRRDFGFLFQDAALIRRLPVWENVAVPLVARGVGREERWARSSELLGRLGLAGRAEDLAEELSGGERRRVALARALVSRPSVLLVDEPTANLDAETAQALLGTLREAHHGGTTLVVASHDDRVVRLGDPSFELERGRLVVEAGRIPVE